MATRGDWGDAYLAQAGADLRAAAIIQGEAPSVLAMLLQMVFEKLGKAALLHAGMMTVHRAQRTHHAATAMMQLIGNNRRKCVALGFRPTYVRGFLTPLVEGLESLNPSVVRGRGADGPWLEYPWENAQGTIRWPAEHLPDLAAFRPRRGGGPRTLNLYRLADQLVRDFDRVFVRA